MNPLDLLACLGRNADVAYEELNMRYLRVVCDAAILARRLADDASISLDAGCGVEARPVRDDESSGGTGLVADANGRPGLRTDLRGPGRPFATVARRAVPSPSSAARRATDSRSVA